MGFYFIHDKKYSVLASAVIAELSDISDTDILKICRNAIEEDKEVIFQNKNSERFANICKKIKNCNLLFLLLTIYDITSIKNNKNTAYIFSNIDLSINSVKSLILKELKVENIDTLCVNFMPRSGNDFEILYKDKICAVGKREAITRIKEKIISVL